MDLLDPEGESEDSFEEMVREVIGFYASVLDEAVAKQQGALELLSQRTCSSRLRRLPVGLGDRKAFRLVTTRRR